MLRLEGPVRGHTDVGRLFGIKFGQLHADTIKVQTRNLFVQMLGQDINAGLVFIALCPQFDLRQNLVRELSSGACVRCE